MPGGAVTDKPNMDFDLTADRALSQGVDIWLNTPRRPLEACGIGGMKAGVNGALNLSTLDGWWDEAWNDAMPGAPPIGWCIGTADTFEDHDLQDALDAESGDPQTEGLDWFNYGQFLRRHGIPESLIYACFLQAQNLNLLQRCLLNHLHMLSHHGVPDLAQRVLGTQHIARLNKPTANHS